MMIDKKHTQATLLSITINLLNYGRLNRLMHTQPQYQNFLVKHKTETMRFPESQCSNDCAVKQHHIFDLLWEEKWNYGSFSDDICYLPTTKWRQSVFLFIFKSIFTVDFLCFYQNIPMLWTFNLIRMNSIWSVLHAPSRQFNSISLCSVPSLSFAQF